MRLTVLKEIPEDETLRQAWNALVERGHQPQIFYTYEWALAVQRAYAATLHPLLFLAYDEQNGLCGLVALAADAANGTASFLCATTGDYCDFLAMPDHREAFVAEVLQELKRQKVREIKLANLPADSATVAALRYAANTEHYQSFARTGYICAQISLASLLRRGENKPVLPRKKMLRRFLNAMGREAPVRLEHARSWEQAESVLPEFIESHVGRFLVTGRISNLVRKERRLFLAELAQLLAQRGWFALTTFAAGRQVFAWNYGFQFLGTWFWYQPTFDSDFEKYSPGFCLLAKLIEEAADKPELHTLDLGLGAEDYKERFANQTRETLYITLNRSRLRHLREFVRYYSAAILKMQPALERKTRSALARCGPLTKRLRQSGIVETARWAAMRVRHSIAARDEVFFYDLSDPDPALLKVDGVCLKPLDLSTLAAAAMQNENDESTLTYLLRCAQHLRTGNRRGFALVNRAGEFLHLAWAAPFDEFYCSEVSSRLSAPEPDSTLLFDCWTPLSRRGRGYYALAIARVGSLVQGQGKRPWIFSAATNTPSVTSLDKAGFKRRFSVIRKRVLWWQTVEQERLAVIESTALRAAS